MALYAPPGQRDLAELSHIVFKLFSRLTQDSYVPW
jgi:hypothetical protein